MQTLREHQRILFWFSGTGRILPRRQPLPTEYRYLTQQLAPQLNAFHRDHLNPYINFHRPCFFPVVMIDAKGKSRKRYPYEAMLTPYDKFTSLPQPEQYLKPGRTLQQLDDMATAISDNEAAKQLNAAKLKLYQRIFEQKHRTA